MRSVGVELLRWVQEGLLQIHATRPTVQGLEQHLMHMYDLVREFRPAVVVVDPISNLSLNSTEANGKAMLMRLIDFLKTQRTTAILTNQTTETASPLADSDVGVSSLMDSWLLLSNIAYNGERTRTLQVLKSRGMPHSNRVREFVFSDKGVELVDVYLSGDRVLTGTARMAQAAQEMAATELRNQDHEFRLKALQHRRAAVDAQIAALNAVEDERREEVELSIARERFASEGLAVRTRAIAGATTKSRVKTRSKRSEP
jgi:circadian clock protein KaiC